jgi:DNA-binding NarL/FixJ family response regulator
MNVPRVLEAVYRLDLSDADVLAELARVASDSLGKGHPILVAEWRDARGILDGSRSVVHGGGPELASVTASLSASTPEPLRRLVTRGQPAFTLASDVYAGTSLLDEAARRGVGDIAGVVCPSDDDGGIIVAAIPPSKVSLAPNLRDTWTRLAHHIAAAWRLRASLQRLEPAAILRTDGTIVDETGPEVVRARDALRSAILRREQVIRGKGDALWSALINGRWTLVDTFAASGGRYVVAYENPRETNPLRALTPTERSIVTHVLEGRSGKWIALELGLSETVVARRTRAALRVLGIPDARTLAGIATARFHAFEERGLEALAWTRIELETAVAVRLTEAERRVLRYLHRGWTTKAIARERGVAARTVINQIASIYRKLGVSSRRELMMYRYD